MSELEFHRLSLSEYDKVRHYMFRFGEGSCQHSFVTMYSLFEKYGDCICEHEGVLYVLRSHLCDERYRVYMAPMCGGDLRQAYQNILEDASRYDRKVKFITLTEKQKEFLEQAFPEQFGCLEERAMAEYLYTAESMATFAGGSLVKRRKEINRFWRLYGDRAVVSRITPEDFPEIMDFEMLWLEENSETHNSESLKREARTISLQLEHFGELHLSGVVLRIDGNVMGFSYGTRLNDKYYDALIEKGDKNIPHIYKVLRQESVKQCAMDCTYVNLEEDLGIIGLRNLKYEYKPAYLLRKYIVTEN